MKATKWWGFLKKAKTCCFCKLPIAPGAKKCENSFGVLLGHLLLSKLGPVAPKASGPFFKGHKMKSLISVAFLAVLTGTAFAGGAIEHFTNQAGPHDLRGPSPTGAYVGVPGIKAGLQTIPAFGTGAVTDIANPAAPMSSAGGRCGVENTNTKILGFNQYRGAGPTWLRTTDTTSCPEAGIDNPVFTRSEGGDGGGSDGGSDGGGGY